MSLEALWKLRGAEKALETLLKQWKTLGALREHWRVLWKDPMSHDLGVLLKHWRDDHWTVWTSLGAPWKQRA